MAVHQLGLQMKHWLRAFFAWLMLAVASLPAHACPTCKEGLMENGQSGLNLARGFELSIYLMLAAPLLILATLAVAFALQIRQAKRQGTYPDVSQLIAQVEAGRSPQV